MDIQQVITGAINSGENTFAIGSVEGINFTVCAVGCDLVILSPDFQRVQIIPGSINGRVQVTTIACCSETGKIAAVYQDLVRVYEPSPLVVRSSVHKLDYRWFETSYFSARAPISNISWNLQGLRLLTTSDRDLQMWQHKWLSDSYLTTDETTGITFHIETGEVESLQPYEIWSCVWTTKLALPIRHVAFSPDGNLFATAGIDDDIIKIWRENKDGAKAENRNVLLDFSFICLTHPETVLGFEWRKTGRYMPSGCVGNALISWCRDNVCRLWRETSLSDFTSHDVCLKYSAVNSPTSEDGEVASSGRRHKHHLKHARKKIAHRIKHLKNMKINSRKPESADEEFLKTAAKIAGAVGSAYLEENEFPGTFHFHLAATISAATDCLLVPSMESYSGNLTFGVHWLNNKELAFSLGTEKILAEALLSSCSGSETFSAKENSATSSLAIISMSNANLAEPQSSEASVTVNEPCADSSSSLANHLLPSMQPDDQQQQGEIFMSATLGTMGNMMPVPTPSQRNLSPSPIPSFGISISDSKKDLLDLKMEVLLKDWHSSPDVLFCIHPVDGSLLIWIVEWLDDASHQPQISFSSRLPHAFPLTDAMSLHQNMSTFNPHDPVYVQLIRRNESLDTIKQLPEQQRNLIYLLTSHNNGSLNLWNLTIDDKSNFCTILNLAHVSRMCGHRFRINHISCHPVLPLLLTTSHHNIKRKNLGQISKAANGSTKTHASRSLSEIQYFNSELILWKVDPVGPLCKTGGVRELARINSEEFSAFSSVAWVPVILPSSTLGAISNSPSSCFVASDGHCLRVYQAVIDARSLLAEINYAKNHKVCSSASSPVSGSTDSSPLHTNTAEDMTIVSFQSTARPGCIIELDEVSNAVQEWRDIQFMHVFPQQMVVDETTLSLETQNKVSASNSHGGAALENNAFMNGEAGVKDFSKATVFREVFYLVVVEKNREQRCSYVHTWKLELSSQSAASTQEPCGTYIHSTDRKLHVITWKVGCEVLTVPEAVRILQVAPAAGHLSSSSIYPACMAPYLFATACTDDKIRFWSCVVANDIRSDMTHKWIEWNMIGNVAEGCVEVDGHPLCVSSAYSGRFACICDPSRTIDLPSSDNISVQVSVYECESSGGTEWIQEDVMHLKNVKLNRVAVQPVDVDFNLHSPVEDLIVDFSESTFIKKIPSIPNLSFYQSNIRRNLTEPSFVRGSTPNKRLVCLDWVSTEDGSHILTVGVGPKIVLYAPVAEDVAQQNLTLMRESSEVHKRPLLRKASSIAAYRPVKKLVHWVNLRVFELDSVDGLPPLPVMICWVRDGILVIGMESEMRVYSQWNNSAAFTCNAEHRLLDGLEDTTEHFSSRLGADLARTPTTPAGFPGFLSPHTSVQHYLSPSHSVLDLAKWTKETSAGAGNRLSMAKKLRPEKEKVASNKSENAAVVEVVRYEGLFEAVRMSSPMLPQYHPKQLIELLNAGKIRRVKAILLHVLNFLRARVQSNSTLMRQGTLGRKNSTTGSPDMDAESCGLRPRSMSRGRIDALLPIDDSLPDYTEIDYIPPLQLHALFAADNDTLFEENSRNVEPSDKQYSELFDDVPPVTVEHAFDDDFVDGDEENTNFKDQISGSRKSVSSFSEVHSLAVFTQKHSHMLTNLLTHVHLAGLSSTDQMHLLAIADAISSFSQDLFDKLANVNGVYPKKVAVSFPECTAGVGYASSGCAADAVDECGLRYLIALKQHEYLLKCLPLKQRFQLKSRGLSSAHVIWALHSETESELLSTIPCVQRGNLSWEELRPMGVGWWIQNINTLRLCFEKMAKTAFQQKNDPMDAALYYLAMKKKNVMCGLFKTVKDSTMANFFAQDFMDAKWKKGALKNAFVLIGKQRFEHAVAFFLLGSALDDALQVCLTKLNDLQLAMVIIRLFEEDPVKQSALMRNLLCQRVLGTTTCAENGVADVDSRRSSIASQTSVLADASPDPFVRSMAYWHLKEYYKALETLVADIRLEDLLSSESAAPCWCISDVFNFYVFLRRHPLVVRHRMAAAGITVGTTEAFLNAAKQLESKVSPAERKLYFKAARYHFTSGCPLLALEVLCKLPMTCVENVELEKQPQAVVKNAPVAPPADGFSTDRNNASATERADNFDWGFNAPETKPKSSDELELKWSDDEAESGSSSGAVDFKVQSSNSKAPSVDGSGFAETVAPVQRTDIMSQQLKFIACLKILIGELATLATGFEVEGGQLRWHLYFWLEKEVKVLGQLCDYNPRLAVEAEDEESITQEVNNFGKPLLLHELLRTDRAELTAKIERVVRRRRWLSVHQSLLRTLAAYCSLHSGQSVGLSSVRMELLLLLQELHQEPIPHRQLTSPLPLTATFPLLTASIASFKTDIADPIRWLQTQSTDLLQSFAEFKEPPSVDVNLSKVYLYYSLAQSLSSCIYESLCSIENFAAQRSLTPGSGFLLRNRAYSVASSILEQDAFVATPPNKWPGVQNLIALLSRERDEDSPNLLLLLVEAWTAVYLALVLYAVTAYDSRWLYRLSVHPIDAQMFATVFGGGGESRVAVSKTSDSGLPRTHTAPSRPADSASTGAHDFTVSIDRVRKQLNTKLLGTVRPPSQKSTNRDLSPQRSSHAFATKEFWLQPKSSVMAYLMAKPSLEILQKCNFEYDSDNPGDSGEESEDEEDFGSQTVLTEKQKLAEKQHLNPNSYAWKLLRLAFIAHASKRLLDFLLICGIESSELAVRSPLVHKCLKLLDSWCGILNEELTSFPDGCPANFLGDDLASSESSASPAITKYRSVLEANRSPFSDERTALPVKRLWFYLVRQDHLTEIFIKHIFRNREKQFLIDTAGQSSDLYRACGNGLPEPLKIIHRDQDFITAFCVNHANIGLTALSSAHEIQELDISSLLEPDIEWINDQAQIQVASLGFKRTPLKDNDDYLLVQSTSALKSELGDKKDPVPASSRVGTAFLTPFIVDRSRLLLRKLCKRQQSGVKRMASHPYLPYYLSGSSDGSIRMWEWGVTTQLYTPRMPGQFAKVTRLKFSPFGNKFGVTDGDGFVCLWQVNHGMALRKPFMSLRCHNKTATDFVFVNQSSSLLATCGISAADQNVCLWDTLLPNDKSLIHCVTCHPEGAQCLMYVPQQQAIYSGGRHGDLGIFDLRQMKIRQSLRVFDHGSVKALALDPSGEFFVGGSSEGEIKVWSLAVPQQLCHFPGEHSNKSSFSLRGVSSSSSHGVVQLYVNSQHKMFSCGADGSLKIRALSSF